MLMAGAVLILADYQLKRIITRSQQALYAEKIDAIFNSLNSRYDRLLATGLVEAYEKDFQDTELAALRRIYYTSDGQRVYPSIINLKGEMLMHPDFPTGDTSFIGTDFMNRALELKNGNFEYTYVTGEKKWCEIRFFPRWDWIVIYVVPLDVMYADITAFRISLIIIVLLITLLVSFLLSILVTYSTRPLIQLSNASVAMAGGDLNRSIDISGTNEIAILGRNFIEMRNSIAKNLMELNKEIDFRKRSEKEREKLNKYLQAKNRDLESIVYASSHDLRSPLVNIHGFSGELARFCRELSEITAKNIGQFENKQHLLSLINKEIPESLGFIQNSADKMKVLLDGLLQVSRAGTVEINVAPLDVNQLVSEVCNAMGYTIQEHDIQIEYSDLPPCIGDEAQINQVFSNLINNAIKYRHPDRASKIMISGCQDQHSSIYCIQDNGIGIEARYQGKIFELYHRLNPDDTPGGEGLGLTIVNKILDRNNGCIWVESEPGQGSKFYVQLPFVTQ
ncbi:MAG: ATP-binding protein [Planctomycetota bacterium]|jgi:signal transduction histidine kinase